MGDGRGFEFCAREEWTSLERCGFGKSLLDVSHFIERRFDTLVKPRDIVRAEYAAVAWSQRTLPGGISKKAL